MEWHSCHSSAKVNQSTNKKLSRNWIWLAHERFPSLGGGSCVHITMCHWLTWFLARIFINTNIQITTSIDNIPPSASHSFIQVMYLRQGCQDNWVPGASVITIFLIESTLLSQSVTQSALFSTGYNWTGATYPRQVRTWRPRRQSADQFSTLRTRI